MVIGIFVLEGRVRFLVRLVFPDHFGRSHDEICCEALVDINIAKLKLLCLMRINNQEGIGIGKVLRSGWLFFTLTLVGIRFPAEQFVVIINEIAD